MTLAEFADLVARMRRSQTAYFRSRSPAVLAECRDFERRVDDALNVVTGRTTPSLFDPPPEDAA